MKPSPYAGKPEGSWAEITRHLVANHPLKLPELRDVALIVWQTLWQTTVGSGPTSVRLTELRVPATIVGYFFEVLFASELTRRHPAHWRNGQSKDEKDLVYVPDLSLSVEIKASGQAGYKVFGNRSYGQKSENELHVKKEKSGFYLTVNFFGHALTLIRFGWIDADDWSPQTAGTGQMSALKKAAYDHKLIAIPGAYRQSAPVRLLSGVGDRTAEEFGEVGIRTIADLLAFTDELPQRLSRIKPLNQAFLDGCYDTS